ncbi:MAG TPA: hypothetical protein VGE12_05910 [Noviherbaspirillum sp.]
MSYAWHQLRCAVKALNRPCSRRAQLAGAYSKLIKLRARDLPSEVTEDFNKLVGGIARYPAKHVFREIKTQVESLDDTQVAEAISLISAMYDVLELYQPRRGRPTADAIVPEAALSSAQERIAATLS